jgi:hypothetical protein
MGGSLAWGCDSCTYASHHHPEFQQQPGHQHELLFLVRADLRQQGQGHHPEYNV